MDTTYQFRNIRLVNERNDSKASELAELRHLSNLLDSKYRLPGGFRVGWDGLLGLIPGIGDIATSMISFYIIVRAAALGCPPVVLARMGLNVLIDNVFDAIPIVGQIFDFFWKANNKNMALLEAHLRTPAHARRSSMWALASVLVAVVAGLVILFAASIAAGVWMWNRLQGA